MIQMGRGFILCIYIEFCKVPTIFMDDFFQNLQRRVLIVLKRQVLTFLKLFTVSWKSAEYTAMADAPTEDFSRISVQSEMTYLFY